MSDFDLAQALVDLSIGGEQSRQTADGGAKTELARTQLDHSVGASTRAGPTFSTVQNGGATHELKAEPVTPPEPSNVISATAAHQHKTLVVLQDACYKHKFGRAIRQRDLETIVERPERTRAAVLGIATAKSRLADAHLSGIDITKTERRGWLGDAAVEAVHGLAYPQDLLKLSQNAGSALAAGKLEVPEHYPYGDLYLGPESLDAINGCLGAVYDGVDAIFAPQAMHDRCHVCIRPPGHHAAETAPCGFCWVNNVHVGIAYARQKYNVTRAVILDIDLHHGDGSQVMAWTINETTPDAIAYYSLHDIYSYPCETGSVDKIREASVSIAAHGHNVHNVHLKTYSTRAEFDAIYERDYRAILQKARTYLEEGRRKGEKAIVVISAGYDASEYESTTMQRHKVNVPTAFYQRFTQDTVELANELADGKVLSVMEGGYGDRAITSAACAHMLGLAVPSRAAPFDTLEAWYELKNLLLLEKHFPGKLKANRKPVKASTVTEPEFAWLHGVERLYEDLVPLSMNPGAMAAMQHSASSFAGQQTPVSNGALDVNEELGRMTLRERKPKPSPQHQAPPTQPRSGRTPRSTPVRRGKAPVPQSAPPLPHAGALPPHLLTQGAGGADPMTPGRPPSSGVPATVAPALPSQLQQTPVLGGPQLGQAAMAAYVDSPTPMPPPQAQLRLPKPEPAVTPSAARLVRDERDIYDFPEDD